MSKALLNDSGLHEYITPLSFPSRVCDPEDKTNMPFTNGSQCCFWIIELRMIA